MTKNCVQKIYEGKDRESKKLAKEFVDYIHLKDVLRRQFSIYTSLNSSYIKDTNSAQMFVMETLNKLDGVSFVDIKTYNALLETKFSVDKMKGTDLNRDISNLIKYKTTKNSDPEMFVNSFNRVVEHIATFREEKRLIEELNDSLANSNLKFLEPRHVIKIAINKFNNKYVDVFNEDDRRLFNLLKSKDEKKIKEYRDTLLRELKENISKVSNDVDDELKDRLHQVMEKLNRNGSHESVMHGYELLSEIKELNK